MLLGHGHPEVLDAVQSQLGKGMTFFANNSASIELAEEIINAVPCAEQVRYVTSGGEADMYALRLARAFTGKNKILKFEGGYHGMSADFNDIESVRALLDEYGHDVAAIIVEPLQRIIPPAPGFLKDLRDECTARSIILIFDEIVTGFRLSYGGAQEEYNVIPDLCSLGKIIGGGFPLAAVAGRKEIMDHFDKSVVGQDKFLMQLGTLSGNPVAAVAGLKTMEILRRGENYQTLRNTGERIMKMITKVLDRDGHPHIVLGHPTLFDIGFTSTQVTDYRSWLAVDVKKNAAFNKTLRGKGIFKSPGKLYPSLAITEEDLQITEAALDMASSIL